MSSILACRRFGSILTVLASLTVTGVAHSQTTNSWIDPSDGKWEKVHHWDDGLPSINQSAVIISNANSKVVTIDKHTARNFSDTLTISNLTVSAHSGVTNILFLDNTGTIALHILNGLTIGLTINVGPGNLPNGGSELIGTNSTLIVDGLLGGELLNDGTMVITGGSLITTNCSVQVGVSVFDCCEPTAILLLSNAVVQARDISIAPGDSSSGTVEMFGGKMTLSSSLTIGGVEESRGSFLVADGALLVVTNGSTGIGGELDSGATLTVSNASFLAADVGVSGQESGAELTINNGTVTLSGELDVSVGDRSTGSVTLNGGMLIVTNNAVNMGFTSGGDLTVVDGIFLGQTVFLIAGNISIQGGTSILSSNFALYFGGAFFISGGQLFVTNAPIIIGSSRESIVSGGLLAANYIDFTHGQLLDNGGSVTVSEGITLGDCNDNFEVGYVTVDGGQLIVTNAAHTGFIDVRSGVLTLESGTLQVDKLVMTNTCGSFIHTGGTLIVGSVILDPNEFHIVSVTPQGHDMLVTWMMGPGATNTLQAAAGGTQGSYTTNGFVDIFVVTNNTTPGTLTNYLDIGAATNKPSRYYRARLSL